MDKSGRIAWFRIRMEWAWHWSVWRMVLDWTVVLYLLIPFLIVAGRLYYLAWDGAFEETFSRFPAELVLLLLVFSVNKGTYRTLAEEGDLLFFRQTVRKYLRLRWYGGLYTVARHAGSVAITVMLLMPVVLVYGEVSGGVLFMMALVILSLKLHASLSRQAISMRFEGWRGAVVSFLVRIGYLTAGGLTLVFPPLVMGLALVILVVLASIRMKRRVTEEADFLEECSFERTERMRYVSLLLQGAGFEQKGKYKVKKRPWLMFAGSESFFRNPDNGQLLYELFLKRWLRDQASLKQMGMFTLAFTVAILFAPLWMKWLILLLSSAVLLFVTRSDWREVKGHPFYRLLAGDSGYLDNPRPIQRAVSTVTFPSIFWLGYLTGILTDGFLIGTAAGLLTPVVMYALVSRSLLV